MVESRQEFDSENENANRIIDNQPDAEGSTNINTDAEYNNRINYGQPEQPYSSSVNPNMGAEIPRNDYTSTTIPKSNPHPSEKEKNNRLGRALIGGLALGALGSLAAVLARRKLVQGFNHTASCQENGAKTVDEGLKHTTQGVGNAVTGVEKGAMQVVTGTFDAVQNTASNVNQATKEGANAVQNKAESPNQSVRSATDTSKYTVHSSNPSQTPDSQYQERSNALNERFSSEQTREAKNTSSQVIYISPSSTRTKVNSFDD